MLWGFLLLALAGCFSGSISYYLLAKTDRLKFLGLLLASFFFIIINIALILKPVLHGNVASFMLQQTIEWGHIFCLVLITSSLLLFVRESKPEFSRFPIWYVIFPLVMILSYLLVYNTLILKTWLLHIYQAGAVAVAALMYGIYAYRESIYQTAFIGTMLFLMSFILYLMLPVPYQLVWQIALTISIVTLFSGFYLANKYYSDQI